MTLRAFHPNVEKNVNTDSNATIVYFSSASHKKITLKPDTVSENPEK